MNWRIFKYFGWQGYSSVYRGIAVISTGTVIAQLIPLLLSPLFTRLYSPSDFGLYAIYLSILAILDVMVAARYELAVSNPASDEKGALLVFGGFLLVFLFGIIFIIIGFFTQHQLGVWMGNDRVASWFPVIILSTVSVGCYKLLNAWLMRKQAYSAAVINKFSQRSGEAAIMLIAGWSKKGYGLLVGDLGGRIVMFVTAFFQCRKKQLFGFKPSLVNIIKVLGEYRDFPFFNTLPAVMNVLSTMLPVFFISHNFGVQQTGFFNFSRTLLAVPFALVSTSISQVLLQEVAARRNNRENIYPLIRTLAMQLGLAGIFMIVVLFPFAPLLFRVIFGSEWITAGEYTRIMVFSYAIQFVSSPLSVVFAALNRIRLYSIWQTVFFLLVLGLLFLTHLPIIHFLVVLTALEVLAYTISLWMIIKLCLVCDKTH